MQLVFAVFTGEAWGYLGSRNYNARVYDKPYTILQLHFYPTSWDGKSNHKFHVIGVISALPPTKYNSHASRRSPIIKIFTP